MASERASCAGRRGPALFPPSPEMPWAKRQGWDLSCQQERRRAAGEGAPAPALPQRSASRTKTRAPGQRGKAASQGSGSRLTAGHLRPVAEPSPFGARSKADWARLGHRGSLRCPRFSSLPPQMYVGVRGRPRTPASSMKQRRKSAASVRETSSRRRPHRTGFLHRGLSNGDRSP